MMKTTKNLYFREPSLHFPKEIQIQTSTYCNAKCTICPHPVITKNIKHGLITENNYMRLMDECSDYKDFIKYYKPFLMNEPLLDSRLPRFIAYARKKLQSTFISFSTNGLLMKGDVINSIIGSGVNEVCFNFCGNSEETYNRVLKGLSFKQVRKNIVDFKIQCIKRNAAIRVIISMVESQPAITEIEESIDFWKQFGVLVVTTPLNNRGGNIQTDDVKVNENIVSYRTCDRPFYKMYITFNGDVIQCSSDWERSGILGNVLDSSIYDVWHSKKLQNLRTHLQENPKANDLCVKCDYNAIYQ